MNQKTLANHAPNPVDLHVGLRVRLRRRALKMSQEKLAESLGLTFQQVQKYERGSNRISASKLYEIARALRAPVAWFFEGLADPAEGRIECAAESEGASRIHDFLLTREGADLANLFPKLPEGSVRRRIIELVRALAEASPEAES
jgi:transcriptional regulator with XRE-family HTH domain